MTEFRRPSYSASFETAALRELPRLNLLERITPESAWGTSTGAGVKVAVIDSGIDATHPDVGEIAGSVAIRPTPEGGFVYDTGPHEDSCGHGTACAGIIRLLAPDCKIYSVKVLGPGLGGAFTVFAAGLRWAIDNNMQVCNLSLGTTKNEFYSALHELTDLAYFRRVMLVTAANNMPTPSFPSVYSSVISVASHESQDPNLFYYNPDPPVEFGAAGINVRVPWLDHGYKVATGNSYATPHIAGLIAKILGKHPELNVFQMKSLLWALAANVSQSGS